MGNAARVLGQHEQKTRGQRLSIDQSENRALTDASTHLVHHVLSINSPLRNTGGEPSATRPHTSQVCQPLQCDALMSRIPLLVRRAAVCQQNMNAAVRLERSRRATSLKDKQQRQYCAPFSTDQTVGEKGSLQSDQLTDGRRPARQPLSRTNTRIVFNGTPVIQQRLSL